MKKYCCELWIGWFRSDFCCKYCFVGFKIWNANPKETLQCSYLVLNSKYCLEAISSTKNKQHIFSTRLTAPRNERNACFSQLVFLLMPPLSLAMLLLSSIYRLQNKIRFEFTSDFDFSKFSCSNWFLSALSTCHLIFKTLNQNITVASRNSGPSNNSGFSPYSGQIKQTKYLF